jgi:phage terminase Nu1 subunit (DNA packaging protein)
MSMTSRKNLLLHSMQHTEQPSVAGRGSVAPPARQAPPANGSPSGHGSCEVTMPGSGNSCSPSPMVNHGGLNTMTTKTQETMTQAEYARRIGVDPSHVYRLKARGIIKLTDDGLVDPEQADAAIAAHRDPSKPLQRKGRPADDALVIRQGDYAKTGAGVNPDDDEENWQELYIRSRAIKERELARSAKMRADAEEGRLVDAELVAMQWANVGVLIRQGLQGIPSRLSAQLAATRNEAEIRRLLQREIDHALTALSDRLQNWSGEDDEAA